MSKTWTAAQKRAIEAGKGNFLVSAGAGSGKTSVLTERIYQLVKSGTARLDQLLVLTFTNKAAAEMKSRVRALIISDPATVCLSPLVEGSSIMTFDAFAFEIVRKYHYDLDLPAEVSIVDEKIFTVVKKRLLDQLLEKYYEGYFDGTYPLFGDFIYHYAIKNDEDIKNFIIASDGVGDLQEDKDGYFASFLEKRFSSSSVEAALSEETAYIKRRLNFMYDKAYKYSTADQAAADQGFLAPLLELDDYDKLRDAIKDVRYPRILRKIGDADDHDLHDTIKGIYQGLQKDFAIGDKKTIEERFLATKKYLSIIIEIIQKLDQELEAFKKQYASFDFADIAKLARRAAQIPSINAELKARYQFIMIDEYQDTSDLQEDFINSIAQDNVFAVGDIKQSIYGFRNANPSLFLNKYQAYARGNGGTLITLAENFRSRSTVIADINSFFAKTMSREVGGVDYSQNQALIFGLKGYEASEKTSDHRLEVFQYAEEEKEVLNQGEVEAYIIAEDIQKKINEGMPVLDHGELRPCRYGDFAILDPRKAFFPLYQKSFLEHGIPLEVSSPSEVSNDDVTIVLKNLSKLAVILANDPNDPAVPHLFVSIVRSFLFRYSDEEIFVLLQNEAFRQDPFYQKLLNKASDLNEDNLEDAISYFVNEFSFLEKLPSLGDVKANYERIESFLGLARMMGRFSWTLKDFSDYFDDLEKYGVELDLETSLKEDSSVQLMTIHASKGLEYKIVYVADLSSPFNTKDSTSSFLASKHYGPVLPLTDDLEAKNIYHLLSKNLDAREMISEKLRLLYVAMTRAQEKLILVRPQPKDTATGPLSLEMAKSFADFLLYYDFPSSCISNKTMGAPTKALTNENLSLYSLAYKQVKVVPLIEEGKKASKGVLTPVDLGALEYGERLHRLLELSDFVSRDVSWILDAKERSLISRVLSLPLFAHADQAIVQHEYAFYDREKDVHGIIDLLLIYKDHLDLVDFKAKDIDDPFYAKQLSAYAIYLSRVFHLPIKKYLLSILEGRLKGVD